MRVLPLLLLIVVSAISCDDNPISATEVREVTWKLETIERPGSAATLVPNPELYTLRFGNDGRVAVRADCNSCGTTYTLDGSSLSMGRVTCTQMFCTLASLDGNYAAALEGLNNAAVTNGRLVLQGGGVTLRFRD